MKGLIWGIVAAVFGLFCFASSGNNPRGPTGSILFGIVCLAVGGGLSYFGRIISKRGIASAMWR